MEYPQAAYFPFRMTVAQLSPEQLRIVDPVQRALDDKCRHMDVFVDALLEYVTWVHSLPVRDMRLHDSVACRSTECSPCT